jgi:hypothetical protein
MPAVVRSGNNDNGGHGWNSPGLDARVYNSGAHAASNNQRLTSIGFPALPRNRHPARNPGFRHLNEIKALPNSPTVRQTSEKVKPKRMGVRTLRNGWSRFDESGRAFHLDARGLDVRRP